MDSYNDSESSHSGISNMDFSFMDGILTANEGDGCNIDKEQLLKEQLANWAVTCQVKKIHVTKLLHILHESLPFLPLDSRTLLQTKRCVRSKEVPPGKYHHFGVASGCKKSMLSMQSSVRTSDHVSIFVNVDGVPLTKSTSHQFWPIIGQIREPVRGKPFTIGIYHGTREPVSFNDFMEDFIRESLELKIDGFDLLGRAIKVKVIGCISDAPARSKICYIVSHNAYFGCSMCFTKGRYYSVPGCKGGRVIFPEVNAVLRTNENFRNREQPDHHKQTRSKLEELDIDMVKDFPAEEMHLLDIGCMKKMLNFMMKGKGTRSRLSGDQISNISLRLVGMRKFVPFDFARKPRELGELPRWKATELHFFLMHSGISVLKGIISEEHYKHFLLLFVAVRLLSC